jgi:hypothetical protein
MVDMYTISHEEALFLLGINLMKTASKISIFIVLSLIICMVFLSCILWLPLPNAVGQEANGG